MQNKIEDLRNHLFAQLERLADDEGMKNPLKLEKELKRAKAISEVSEQIVNSAKAETDFLRVMSGIGGKGSGFIPLPENKGFNQLTSEPTQQLNDKQ